MKNKKRLAALMFAVIMIAVSCISATAAQEYADTSEHWAKTAISRFSAEGIVNGYNGNFSPDSEIIRGDAAIIISRLFNLAEASENFFGDINSSDYYLKSANAVKSAGIMQGKSETAFAPLENLTRQETAVILSRSLKLENGNSSQISFTDSDDIADWARESIYACAYNGVFSGYEDGSIKPNQNITRAEFVTVLDNAFAYISAENVTENIFGRILTVKQSTSFSNTKISGDIFSGSNKLYFADTSVSGRIILWNTNEVTLSGSAAAESITAMGGLKIQTSEDSVVQKLIISGNGTVHISGNIRNIEIESETNLVLENASVKTVVSNKKSTVSVDGNSYIESVTLYADNSVLKGVGAVKSAYVKANNCTITTSNTEVTTDKGAFDTIVGTEKISENSTAVSPDNTQTIGGSSEWTETVVSTEIDKDSLGGNDEDDEKDEEKVIDVYLAIDNFILGNGIEDFILPPKKIKSTNKTSVAKTIVKEIGGMIRYSGTSDNSFYMTSVDASAFAPAALKYEELPQCFRTAVESEKVRPEFDRSDMSIKNTGGWLGEFDYTSMSGWMYSVNNKYPNVGMSDYILSDGDVIRLTYTLWGWGADVGGGYATGGTGYANYYKIINLTDMIKEYADNPTTAAYIELCESAAKISEE